jgi:hypothetical protein
MTAGLVTFNDQCLFEDASTYVEAFGTPWITLRMAYLDFVKSFGAPEARQCDRNMVPYAWVVCV